MELGQPLWGSLEGVHLFPVATPQLPEPHVGASVPCQHPGCWLNSSVRLKQKRGVDGRTPHGVPWPCCPYSALWGGKTADLQPEQQ